MKHKSRNFKRKELKVNKTRTVLIVVLLLCTVCVAKGEEKKLGVTLDLTYMSKYMSKGGQSYGQQGALFKTVDLDFWGSGFGLKIIHQEPTSSGYVGKSRFNYRPYYKNKVFKDTPYVMKYNIGVQYEHYYRLSSNKANTTWEWKFAFSWPKLLGCGLVPKYIAYYETPAHNNVKYRNKAGWHHSFGCLYNLDVPELPNPLILSAFIDYRDGLGGPSKDHDWSHATLGLSTKIKLSNNLTFVPGIYHQITMDKSISSRKDITYAKLSMKYKF